VPWVLNVQQQLQRLRRMVSKAANSSSEGI
jgi:hypothetical protein